MTGPADQIAPWAPLLTERLLLRSPEQGEAEKLAALALLSGARDKTAIDLTDTRARIAMAGLVSGARSFAILERSSGRPVGGASLTPILTEANSQEVALWIGEPFLGRSYGTQAGRALIDQAFLTSGAELLWCTCRAGNARGRRVIEKFGFQYRQSGTARSVALRGAINIERFAIDRTSWLSLAQNRPASAARLAEAAELPHREEELPSERLRALRR